VQHFRGNIVAVIDTETTPLEIWQMSVIPLTSEFKPHPKATELAFEMRPNFPDACDRQVMRLSESEFSAILNLGTDQMDGKTIFLEYVAYLRKKFGNESTKILPMGQNWAFDCGKIKDWLGDEIYFDTFFPWYRDPMVIATFLNDVAGFDVTGRFETAPFPKANLDFLAKTYNIVNLKAHDALQDSLTTAKVYRSLVQAASGDYPKIEDAARLAFWVLKMLVEHDDVQDSNRRKKAGDRVPEERAGQAECKTGENSGSGSTNQETS
jgi:DNA polymerase III epsilon subunit-like protein